MTTTAPKLRPSLRSKAPRVDIEQSLWESGHSTVVGFDEVGKGSWAGPLTVGAVIIPTDRRVYKIRDSKQLHESEREALVDRIKAWSQRWAVGHASAQQVWHGLRSRPTWRVLCYSAEDPPAMRGLVLVDAVDGHIVEHLTEDNPEGPDR